MCDLGVLWDLQVWFLAKFVRQDPQQPNNPTTPQPRNPTTQQPYNPTTPTTQQPNNPTTPQPHNPRNQIDLARRNARSD